MSLLTSRSLAALLLTLPVVGCLAGSEESAPPLATAADPLTVSCGTTAYEASGSATTTKRTIVATCLNTDTACQAGLREKYAAYTCRNERWVAYQEALVKAADICDRRLAENYAGINCPCQCPTKSAVARDALCFRIDLRAFYEEAPAVAGTAVIRFGRSVEDPAYYVAYCDISQGALSTGRSNVTCNGANNCPEAGVSAPKPGTADSGVNDSGSGSDTGASDSYDYKRLLLESSFTGA